MGSDDWSTAEESDLIRAARGGSRGAMTELYARHRPMIFGYLARMTRDRDLAEETFAATFASFFESLPRYRDRGRLAAYLLRIARSRLVDELRARVRFGGGSAPSARDAPVEAVPGADPEPVDRLARSEFAALAERALEALPEALREVVVLRLYEGLDYATIARVIGVGEATARSRMRYALQALRRSLDRSQKT